MFISFQNKDYFFVPIFYASLTHNHPTISLKYIMFLISGADNVHGFVISPIDAIIM